MLEVSYGVQMIRSSNSLAFSWEPDAHARCMGEEQGCSCFLPTPSESLGEPSPVQAQRLTLVTFGLCRTYAGWPPRCSHSAHATPSRRMSSATPCVCGSSSPEKFPSRISSQVGPAVPEQLCFPARFTESWTAPLPTKIIILDNYSRDLALLDGEHPTQKVVGPLSGFRHRCQMYGELFQV